jgi:glyoxylase-like metal-dependent hydrolase (beta-lactamase superfamily II)
MIGDARVTRVVEYSGPTHPPEFLFPEIDKRERDAELAKQTSWMAPHHYVPHMDRLIVTIQIWVVHAGGNVILIDSGVGNHKQRPAPRMDGLNTLLMPWLEAAGAGPEQVTHVVHTHLHTDHVGGNTVLQDGKWVPAFPRARHIIPRAEFDYWQAEHDRGDIVQAGSFADSVLPVLEAGMVDFADGTSEVAGCLQPLAVPGHAPGMLAYRLRSRGEEGLFSTDTMHSPIQVANPHWNDRYVLWPDQAKASRALVLSKAAEWGSLIMPMHFGAPYCGYVRTEGEGYRFEPGVW